MSGGLSGGAVGGIVVGSIAFFIMLAGCVFLKTVYNHRRRVRRAVQAASAPAPAAAANTRAPLSSRYPEAMPCENYSDLFPDEEPAQGNVVFQSRADIDRMRDVLVRIEDAGEDQSSEDFTTTEMVSINNSFAHGLPQVQAGQALQDRLKGQQHPLPPHSLLLAGQMGSFDNEHNVAMSLVSHYPTPASSMPAGLAAGGRARGPGHYAGASVSFHPGASGSYAPSFGAPPTARADGPAAAAVPGGGGLSPSKGAAVGASKHFSDTHRRGGGGLRLLVPALERGPLSGDATPTHAGEGATPLGDDRTPLSERESRESRDAFAASSSSAAASLTLSRPPTQREFSEAAPSLLQARLDANASSFSAHLSPSLGGMRDTRRPSQNRPPGLPMGPAGVLPSSLPTLAGAQGNHATNTSGGAGLGGGSRGGLLGATRHDPVGLHHHQQVRGQGPLKKQKLRIHRQHRVRNVDKGGYVVLEESESDSEGEHMAEAAGEQQEATTDAGRDSAGASPAPQSEGGVESVPTATPSPSPPPAAAAAKPKEKEKKRYYFEKLSSLDVYGRGQYLPGATGGGYPPAMEGGSLSSESEGDREQPANVHSLPPTQQQQQRGMQAPVYTSNSSRKPT